LHDNKPFEESKNYHRYKVKVDPKTQAKLLVKSRRVDKSTYYFQNVSKSDIDLWYKQKLITDAEYEFLLRIWELNNEKREVDNRINDLRNKKNTIIDDQNRLRQNLRSIGTSRSEERLRNKYITKLDEQEIELEKIEAEIKELTKKSEELEEKINDEIRKRHMEV
ncbi:MAG: hypothetical protein ACFFDN_13215, partial [Candidatus Hodarchaeota archaeon]